MSQGYTWAVYEGYEIFRVPASGGTPMRLTNSPGYDAEAVYRPDGGRILFTSTRDGDLDLYDMAPDGSGVRRLTSTPGYDGGAFYTADGKSIVFRGRHPQGEELAEYQGLLAKGLIRPGKLDLFVMDADGSNLRRITTSGEEGATNWAPYPHPDGQHIVFASNRDDFNTTLPGRYGFNFELYLIGIDGTGVTRLTWNPSFDGFPMFSSDGRQLVWCGNYVPGRSRDTDVMLADWDATRIR
jgi:Tol biopolymer transport system component